MPFFFSIIIPTRNRPSEFRRALESVLAQSQPDIEVIVVDDGSEPEHEPAYSSTVRSAETNQVRFLKLIPRPNGHGAGYSRNFGVSEASAPYLCFLDDDDYLLDLNHLSRAFKVIRDSDIPVDVYMTNQAAFLRDEQQPGPIWLEDLAAILTRSGDLPDLNGAHTVSVKQLLQSQGFCHLNTLIVRRELYNEIGGIDEALRWEEDHDFYLRLIDRAAVMKYIPVMAARHNVPDPALTANITTALPELERYLCQLFLFDRAQRHARNPAIREYGRLHKSYTLKRITVSLAAAGRHLDAAFYAREALGVRPTFKWAGYTVWRALRALGARPGNRVLG